MWETWVPSLGWEDPLEEEMAIHSSILAWRIPWTEKPSRLPSTGSQSQTQLSNFTFTFTFYLVMTTFCCQFYSFLPFLLLSWLILLAVSLLNRSSKELPLLFSGFIFYFLSSFILLPFIIVPCPVFLDYFSLQMSVRILEKVWDNISNLKNAGHCQGHQSTAHTPEKESLGRGESIKMQENTCEEWYFLQHSLAYSHMHLLTKHLLSPFSRFWRYCGEHTDKVSTFIELILVVGQCFWNINQCYFPQ